MHTNQSPNDLAQEILHQLLAGEIRRLDQVKADLVERNNAFLPQDKWQVGFLVKGVFFKPSNTGNNWSQSTRVLEDPLVDEGNTLYADNKELSDDRQSIKQVLVQTLWDCETEQDIRDALPDCLNDLLPPMVSRLPRTRPMAFTIQDNPRAMKYFNKVLPRIEYYCAMRLIF